MSMDPVELSLAEAAQRIGAGELSPVELTEAVLRRIAAVEGRVNAFVTVTGDRALADARRAEARLAAGAASGPLHGIPVAVKDLVDTAGIQTASGSQSRAGHVPDTDAEVMRRLTAAGAVLVGKTHTDEFAYGVFTPPTRNPWRSDAIAGGSSGGSAAAVAARMCHGAIGTDTSGSIRIPAAACGAVGLKPTYGRVSRSGVTPLAPSLDHTGPLARTTRDVAVLMDVLAGHDPADPATVDVPVPAHAAALEAGIDGMVVGVPTNYFFDRVDSQVETAVRHAIAELERLGARLREVWVPHAELYRETGATIVMPEASAYHRHAVRRDAKRYTETVRLFLEAGETILATDYIEALEAKALIQHEWRRMFDDVDAVVTPTLPATAARVGQAAFRWPDGIHEGVAECYARICAPASLTGFPALSLPCGFDAAGLPIGLQVIGREFAEPAVLRVGHAYEVAAGRAWAAPVSQERQPNL